MHRVKKRAVQEKQRREVSAYKVPHPKKPAEASPETPIVTKPEGDAFHNSLIPRDSCISVSGAFISVKRMGINDTESKIEARRNNWKPEGSSIANNQWPMARPPQTTPIWIEKI